MTSIERNHSTRRRTSGTGRGKRHKTEGPVQGILGWVALAVVLVPALWNGALAPVVWTLLCLATLALFVVQVTLDIRHGLPGPARNALWVALPFFAVLVWVQIQSLTGLPPDLAHPLWEVAPEGARPAISAHPDAGRQVAMRLACYGMLFWIFLRAAGAAHNGGRAYIQGIAVFSSALAIYGFVSYSSGENVLLGLEGDEVSRFLQASFLNPNTYATFAVFGVLANVAAYMHVMAGSDGGREHFALRDFLEAFFAGGWLYAFGALVGVVALAMTASRAGVAAGVIGIVLLAWARRRQRGAIGPAVWAIPLALIGFAGLFMTSGLVKSVAGANDVSRFAVYRQVVVGTLDRPWLGHGAGAYPQVFRLYTPLEQAHAQSRWAHNSYLENAFEFGLPAAGLFYVALGLIGWRLVRGVLTRKRNQAVPAFALACFAAAAFHAGFDFSLQFPANAALFAAILGIGWSQSFPTRQPRTAAPRDSARSARGG